MKTKLANSVFIAFLIFFSCKKDAVPEPSDFPNVSMKEVIATEDSVYFIADINNLGNNFSILSHGFLWNNTKDLQFTNSFSKLLGPTEMTGEFSFQVNSDLIEGETYYVRPFVQNESFLVLGNILTFINLLKCSPEIIDFEPKHGDFGDTIIISGKNLLLMKSGIQVSLGSDTAYILSTSSEEVRFIIPQKLSKSGEVTLSVKSGEKLIQANTLFYIDGQTITDFNPKEGIIGETVIQIIGTGFDNNSNKAVRFGKYVAEILDATDTKLTVRLPYSMDVGNMLIEVEIDGKIATSTNEVLIKSRWSKRNDFPGKPRMGGYFSIIDNIGYLICGSTSPGCCDGDLNEVWKYDISKDLWIQLNNFPGKKRSLGSGFMINKEIYYGLGINNYLCLADFWKYNIQTDTWIRLNDFPGITRYDAVQLTINDKGYLIGGDNPFDPSSQDIWEYEPILNKWTQIGYVSNSLQATFIDARDGYFQKGDKAYLLILTSPSTEKKFLYEFSPDINNFLVTVSEFPSGFQHMRLSCFLINQTLFFGDEYIPETGKSDFWKYNFDNDEWIRIESLPGKSLNYSNWFSNSGLGFVINMPEIWTYDPSK